MGDDHGAGDGGGGVMMVVVKMVLVVSHFPKKSELNT